MQNGVQRVPVRGGSDRMVAAHSARAGDTEDYRGVYGDYLRVVWNMFDRGERGGRDFSSMEACLRSVAPPQLGCGGGIFPHVRSGYDPVVLGRDDVPFESLALEGGGLPSGLGNGGESLGSGDFGFCASGTSGTEDVRSDGACGAAEDLPCVGDVSGQSSGQGVEGADGVRGLNYAKNKSKREKKKKNVDRKRAEAKLSSEEVSGDGGVPEWRRKSPEAFVHKGAFSECSVGVQRELRESRARMLVANNEAAVVEAEQRRRCAEARLKSRSVEEEVERNRLELDKRLRGLRAEVSVPRGYAETIASAMGTPSLSEGSVSPDSSISVAELNKKDEAIRFLVDELEVLKVQNKEKVDLLIVRVMELEQKAKAAESSKAEVKPEQPQARQPADRTPGSWERQAFGREFDRVVGGGADADSDSEEELTYEEMEAEAAQFFSTGALR